MKTTLSCLGLAAMAFAAAIALPSAARGAREARVADGCHRNCRIDTQSTHASLQKPALLSTYSNA